MATPLGQPHFAASPSEFKTSDAAAMEVNRLEGTPPGCNSSDKDASEKSTETSPEILPEVGTIAPISKPICRMPSSRDVLVALTYGLELTHHGAMLVEAEGHPQLANRAALAILQKKDGLSLCRTGIVADRAADTRLLHRLLQEAISSPQSGEPKDSPLTLPRRSARNSLIVRVMPGPELEHSDADSRTALLKLYDQDMGLVVDQRALSALYGLTRGEAALATRLVQGLSIEDAAGELFISVHTARTHLKRIFMKTDTHRQTELVVRMLLTVL